jgi:hypothetical protein
MFELTAAAAELSGSSYWLGVPRMLALCGNSPYCYTSSLHVYCREELPWRGVTAAAPQVDCGQSFARITGVSTHDIVLECDSKLWCLLN